MAPTDRVSCPEDAPTDTKLQQPGWAGSFNFTGDLRPVLYSPRRQVPASIRKPDYANNMSGASDSEQRDRASNNAIRIYTDEELDGEYGLRHACRMGREVLDVAGKALRVGVTTDEIDRVVHEAALERDCYPSPLNYYNFPKSVCTSVNEVICHGIPDYREVQDGDIVNIDVTTFNRGGYHGDLNETFCVGNVDDEGRKLVKTSFECLGAALDMVKPGTLYRDLGTAIHKVSAANNCSVVRTYCGHGIGSLFHTAPNVPHYPKNKAKGTMKAGHVFTIEPMINLGSPNDKTWGDNWTAVTTDGKRSSQFERECIWCFCFIDCNLCYVFVCFDLTLTFFCSDTLLVTDTGYELLTGRTDEPVMKWNDDLNNR
jgi:methionyl aminopeptidase